MHMFQLDVLRLLPYAPVAACLSKSRCTGCALQPYMVLALDPVLCTGKLSIVLPFCELVKHAQVSWPMISRLIFRQVGGCLI